MLLELAEFIVVYRRIKVYYYYCRDAFAIWLDVEVV